MSKIVEKGAFKHVIMESRSLERTEKWALFSNIQSVLSTLTFVANVQIDVNMK